MTPEYMVKVIDMIHPLDRRHEEQEDEQDKMDTWVTSEVKEQMKHGDFSEELGIVLENIIHNKKLHAQFTKQIRDSFNFIGLHNKAALLLGNAIFNMVSDECEATQKARHEDFRDKGEI